jgi:hypothetical protein
MKTRILAFAGCKQAGKSTCSNFLHGYQLRAQEVIQDFAITEHGKLVVKTEISEDGKTEIGETFLDTSRKDPDFVEWAMYNMWPFVKKYSFADTLKEIGMTLFGLTYEQVYGSEAYKNQLVEHLRWENMPGVITHKMVSSFMVGINPPIKTANDYIEYDKDFTDVFKFIIHKPGPMTVREFLQYFGTEVCRKIYEPIWVNRTIKDIQQEEPLLAVIDDCRFENEIRAVQEAGGKVIGLTRNASKDKHDSERVIEDHSDMMDAIIDNQNMEIFDVCKSIITQLDEWGWLGAQTVTNNVKGLHTIKGK